VAKILDGRNLPASPDSAVDSSASQSGIDSLLNNVQGVQQAYDDTIVLTQMCGREQGSSATKSQTVMLDSVTTTSNKRALLVSSSGSDLTASAATAATIDAADESAVAANPLRKGLVLVNTSANWISIAFGTAAVLYSGITLAANGGSFTMDANTLSTAEVRAIASAAGSNLAIQEFV